ncbi:MAG: TolC family protein [Terriglobia bacterium]
MRRRSIHLAIVILAVLPVNPPLYGAQLTLPAAISSSARSSPGATPLAALVTEAELNNPGILAARRSWQAAAQIPSQAATLPDPELQIQQFSVGSPRPFAGYSNSDFAYIGFGISQDLPYPGKLRLKGEMAGREAAATRDEYKSVEREMVEQLSGVYFQLAEAQQILGILDADRQLLAQIEKSAEADYRVGRGSQQGVLKAQLQETRLLRDLALERQQKATLEANIKQLLNRPADSSDIEAAKLTETPLTATMDELMTHVRTGNPAAGAQQEQVERQGLRVELAHKDFYPDFNVQYMWQHTGAPFRDYYMLSFGVKLPIHRRSKQQPELAQAAAELDSSRRQYEAQVQQLYFDVREQYLAAQTGAHVLKLYRQGLLPQATAEFQAGLAAYESHREDFETLFNSFLDVLNLNQEYWQTLANHEIAIARLEELTGVSLL